MVNNEKKEEGYKITREGSDDVLRINANNWGYIPAVESSPEAMSYVIDKLSQSPQVILEAICGKIGVKKFYGSTYKLSTSGNIIDIDRIMEGKNKAKYLKKININNDRVVVYTDSIHDIDLCMLADEVVVTNADRFLLKVERKKGWRVV